MVIRRRLLGAAVAAGVALLAGPPASAQQAAAIDIASVDATAYPSVTAVVTTPAGLDGTDHPASAFAVLEGGEPVDAAVEQVPTSNLEIMLVLDTSGSMEGAPLTAAKDAAVGFLEALPPEVGVGIVGFGPTPALLAAPTTDRAALAATLADLEVAGETALYDAVVHASQQFTAGTTDRVVVLLSDGGDTASAATLAEAESAATGVTLNVIDLVTPESNRAALDQLAAAGHGTVSSATDPAALGGLYETAARAIVNRYRISYESSGHGQVELTVRLDTGDAIVQDTAAVTLPDAPAPPPDEQAAGGTGARVAGRAEAPDVGPSRTALLVGGAAVFLALLILGLVAMPADPRGRLTRARLSTTQAVADRPSPAQITQRLSAAADEFLERRGRRQTLAVLLEVAGISLRTGEFVVLVVAATVVSTLGGLALGGVLAMLLGLVIVPLGARTLVRILADRRRTAFADALPDNLQLLTGTLRSGYGLLQALDTLAREAPEPAGGEFRRVLLEVRVGRDPGDALRALAVRMQSEDFEWVVGAIEINREVGGDLATIMDNVAETIRERQRLHRQMRALTAEGRISGYVLTALPVLLALALIVLNPEYIGRLGSGPGLVMVGVGVVMLTVGWLWIQRLCRIEF
jgi:tight adherence protein B